MALALFLRSRRVLDRAIINILNKRYTPTVCQLGAIRNKMKSVRRAEHESGQVDLTHNKMFSAPENVDQIMRLDPRLT